MVNIDGNYWNTAFHITIEYRVPRGVDVPQLRIHNADLIHPYPSENRGVVAVSAVTLVQGSATDLFYDPIPDYMFEVDTADIPNAVVTVNDVVAECAAGRDFLNFYVDNYTFGGAYSAASYQDNNCSYQYFEGATPVVLNSTSDHADGVTLEPGGVVTIAGTGFRQHPGTEVQVSIGGVDCTVTSHTDAEIQCLAQETKTGVYHPTVIASDVGQARVHPWARPVYYPLVIAAVEPLGGGVRGGNVMAVTGTGLSNIGPENQVTPHACSIHPRPTPPLPCSLSHAHSRPFTPTPSLLPSVPLMSFLHPPPCLHPTRSLLPSYSLPLHR